MMKRPDVEVLTDGRLRLRRVDPEDVDPLLAAVQESLDELMVWMPWAHPDYSRDDACWFVCSSWLNWHSGTAFEFVIERAEDGLLVGMCGLNGVTASDGRGNLGYWVRSSHTRQGICTDAARLVARFGLGQLGMSRIRLFHAVGNLGSQRVAEKVGFVLEGVQRQRITLHMTKHDTKLYSLVSLDEITASSR